MKEASMKEVSMREVNGTVSRLKIFTKKGDPGTELEECRFLEDCGMEGDRHATGGERQVTLLPSETAAWMAAQEKKGLCFSRFKANIETAGEAGSFQTGDRLQAGTVVFSVSGFQKECFPECPLFSSGEECGLSKGGLFLKVVTGGCVHRGDEIKRI